MGAASAHNEEPPMLYDPARHEPLQPIAWDAQRARSAIEWIVRDTEARFSPDSYWPVHPKDLDPGDDPRQISTTLYFGAAGVIWALRHLHAVGAVPNGSGHDWPAHLPTLRARNRAWLDSAGSGAFGSYLMGDTPILMMAHAAEPTAERTGDLVALIEGNLENPARELMWGSPGTLLAASFLHERTGETRWADLYRRTAAQLWSELLRSDAHGCRYWLQELYGHRCTYLDGVHGFVATAHALIRGRHLLGEREWDACKQCIAETIARTATRESGMVNWRPELLRSDHPMLMQYCHGAPGFVVCLARWPGRELDDLLVAAGEAIWAAGPLAKGSNLCHGTAGNGYAFLVLHERTGEQRWLDRARAFAMHAIAQAERDERQYGRMRYSLWTGDLGLAIYLWDCLRARPAFPTLDVFDAAPGARQAH
jgi:hypothetical protein